MTDVATSLAQGAAAVLRANDRGGHTVAAPALYPHQWSWDAAFVAIGWSFIDVPRAIAELRHLLRGQWSTGMIPQIVFSPEPGYFPGPDRWRTADLPQSPTEVATSGICQPAVHGLALHIIGEQARRSGPEDTVAFEEFLAETFDQWLDWHRWLDQQRGVHPCGLIEIHHPWESGMDNSPRWDAPCARIQIGPMAAYQREDTRYVAHSDQRPADEDYDRYLWLVEQLVAVGYDDRAARNRVDFRVGDVFFTAAHALSAGLLARFAESLHRPDAAGELTRMAEHRRRAVTAAIDPGTGLARDYDMRAETWLDAATIGGFAPLLCGTDPATHTAQVDRLLGAQWCEHPALAMPTPPTTAPDSPAFVSQNYWRGPSWPVLNWLLTWSLQHYGYDRAAQRLSTACSVQLGDATFAEYYDSVTGAPLGSMRQSWTAAVALAWERGR
ncbi:glucosylglycerate hydrolase [Ruania zhangjianzhongii]|uniref:glucosylglycerate hydrolase n=1 Tax=Ruania zhangjianzhongii TaxID=2603206 RepID=UPI0011C97E1E|nr:glycoside hydrolase 100 family protein [Ruania zhangjianzhongii]